MRNCNLSSWPKDRPKLSTLKLQYLNPTGAEFLWELQLGGCDGTATKSDFPSFRKRDFTKKRQPPPLWQHSISHWTPLAAWALLSVGGRIVTKRLIKVCYEYSRLDREYIRCSWYNKFQTCAPRPLPNNFRAEPCAPTVLITGLDQQCKSMSFRLHSHTYLEETHTLRQNVSKKFIEDSWKFINR